MAPTESSIDAAWRSFFESERAGSVAAVVSRYPEERSVYVDVVDLHGHDPAFVESLFAEPATVLRRGAEVLREDNDALGRVNLRLRNHPSLIGIRSVRARHLGKLVTVEGAVDAVGPVEARVEEAAFVCDVCGGERREHPREVGLSAPARCPECALTDTMALEHDRATFVDVQRVTLREPDDEEAVGGGSVSGGSVDGGGTVDGRRTAERRVPADGRGSPDGRDATRPCGTIAVTVDDDLVDTLAVGDHVRVTGIVGVDRHGEANRFSFALDGVAVDEQRPGRSAAGGDVPDRVKESIRARWESVVDG